MQNPLRYLFNLVAPEPQRFIDIDGRPWFKKTFLDKRDPAVVIGGAVALGFIFSAAANAPEGEAVIRGATQALESTGNFAWGMVGIWCWSDIPFLTKKLNHHAIDTTGRSPAPADNLSLLLKVHERKSRCRNGLLFTSVLGTLHIAVDVQSSLKGLPPHYSHVLLELGMPFIKFGGDYLRCKKLLSGEFTFCGTPPREMEKAKDRQVRRFGVLNPAGAGS